MGIRQYLCMALLGAIAVGCDGGGNSGGVDASIDAKPVDAAIPTEKFSFFVTSLKRMRELSGNTLGFGGDLRFGETGPGAGLRGADKICSTIAEMSMPNAGLKTWRAFLSAKDGGNGAQVNAIDDEADECADQLHRDSLALVLGDHRQRRATGFAAVHEREQVTDGPIAIECDEAGFAKQLRA